MKNSNGGFSKLLATIQMLLKAPTVFVYASFQWMLKIDSHKSFLCCLLQLGILAVIFLAYALSSTATVAGECIILATIILQIIISTIFTGIPASVKQWKYLLFGDGKKIDNSDVGKSVDRVKSISKVEKSDKDTVNIEHNAQDDVSDDNISIDFDIDSLPDLETLVSEEYVEESCKKHDSHDQILCDDSDEDEDDEESNADSYEVEPEESSIASQGLIDNDSSEDYGVSESDLAGMKAFEDSMGFGLDLSMSSRDNSYAESRMSEMSKVSDVGLMSGDIDEDECI